MKQRPRWETLQPAGYKQAYFLGNPVQTTLDWGRTRKRGQRVLSSNAQLKLEWIIFYHTLGKENAKQTALHFGVTRKTLHKWLKRFKTLGIQGLEEESRAPIRVRSRQITLRQRVRVRSLRASYPQYGKLKLVTLYRKQYQEAVSSWKIQKIIEEDHLYYDKVKISKLRNKRLQAQSHKKQRITKLIKEKKVNYLWHVDTVVLTLSHGGYRYLLTAIDEVSKLSYARLYTTHASRNTKDFLGRLMYVTDQKILNIHTDNGSEFKKEFEEACCALHLPQWYSRPHTPKDNAVLERFNRTIQEEFIAMSESDIFYVDEFNKHLTEWLIEYNFNRPHKTLDYLSPLEYLDLYYHKLGVSPMYSSPTPS